MYYTDLLDKKLGSLWLVGQEVVKLLLHRVFNIEPMDKSGPEAGT